MKKTVKTLVSVALIFSAFLSVASCSRKERNAYDILLRFCEAYPLYGTVYNSGTPEDELDDILTLLFEGEEGRVPRGNFAVMLYGSMDTVSEVGVFVTSFGHEIIDVIELAERRIGILDDSSEGEGFIIRDREVVVYGFVGDKDRAVRLFKYIF